MGGGVGEGGSDPHRQVHYEPIVREGKGERAHPCGPAHKGSQRLHSRLTFKPATRGDAVEAHMYYLESSDKVRPLHLC